MIICVAIFIPIYLKRQDRKEIEVSTANKVPCELHIKGVSQVNQFQKDIEVIVPSWNSYLVSIIRDAFTNENTIKFRAISAYISDKVSTYGDGDLFTSLDFGFRNINGDSFIFFSTHQKSIKFKKGDSIIFLFKNEDKVDFKLIENGYRVDKDNEGIIIESFTHISQEFIEKFRDIECLKWKYVSINGSKPVTGSLGNEKQKYAMEMALVFIHILADQL